MGNCLPLMYGMEWTYWFAHYRTTEVGGRATAVRLSGEAGSAELSSRHSRALKALNWASRSISFRRRLNVKWKSLKLRLPNSRLAEKGFQWRSFHFERLLIRLIAFSSSHVIGREWSGVIGAGFSLFLFSFRLISCRRASHSRTDWNERRDGLDGCSSPNVEMVEMSFLPSVEAVRRANAF